MRTGFVNFGHRNVAWSQHLVTAMLCSPGFDNNSGKYGGKPMPNGIQPKRTALSAAIAAALVGSPVAAQESGSERGVNRTRALEEITVTATRVEESLQDVPIAVHALGGDDISPTT
jgi:hypothetical protein